MAVLSIIIPHSALGQNSARYWNPIHKTLTTNNGLPSMECYSTFQDSKGYIWVATDHGAAKYNGHTFDVFTTNEGLGSNTIYDIHEDKQGRIWFFSNVPELYFLEDGEIKPYKYNAKLREIQPDFFRYHDQFLFEGNPIVSSVQMGTFFIDSRGAVTRFDEENSVKSKEKYSMKFSVVKGHLVHSEFDSGIVDNLRHLIALKNDEAQHAEWLNLGRSLEMLYSEQTSYLALGNRLWITQGNESNLFSFDQVILSIALIEDYIWLTFTSGGVKRLKIDKEKIVSEEHFFHGLTVSDVFQSDDGSIWLTTLDEGLFQIQNLHLESLFNANSHDPIHSVGVLDDYLVLHSYFTVDLLNMNTYEIDKSFGNARNILSIPNTDFVVFTRYAGKNSRTHFDIGDTDIMYMSDADHVQKDFSYFNRLGYDLIKSKGDEYIVGTRFGVSFLESDRTPMRVNSGVRALEWMDDHHLWVSNFHSTSILNLKTGELSIPEQPQLRARAVDILKAPNGITYFATHGNGIWALSDQLMHFTTGNGLPRNFVFKIIHNKGNQFWLIGQQGVSLVDFQEDRVRVIRDITSNDLSCEKISDCTISNGTIYVATNKGLRRMANFDASPASNLRLYHKGARVDGRQIGQGSSELKYSENSIRFEYEAVSFSGEPVYFRYKIGESTAWNMTTESFANFTDLPPGDYSFQLEASTDQKNWVSCQSILFKVHPPFWSSWWFQLTVFLLFSVVAFLIVRWRIRRMKAKERIKNRIIELQQVALTQQLNPHFVFNAMGSLQNSILKGDVEKANGYIVDFSRFLRSGLEASRMELIPLKEEMKLMENYLLLEQKRMVGQFTFTIEADTVESPNSIFVPPFIAQPFLENCIKHGISLKKEEGYILLRFEQSGDSIECTVKDDGVGLKSEKTDHKSHGISIAHERIQLLHQLQGNKPTKLPLVQLKPGANGGTVVLFTLPIIRKDVKSDNY